jgi:hypothetical protein
LKWKISQVFLAKRLDLFFRVWPLGKNKVFIKGFSLCNEGLLRKSKSFGGLKKSDNN